MKKQIIILLVCLVFVAGLGGALWFLMGYEPAGQESSSSAVSQTVQLIDKTAYDLDTVTVENTAGTYTIKNLGENKYTLEGMTDVPLNESMLSSVATLGVQLSATSLVKEDAADLAPYGLSDPTARITAKYTDSSAFTLLVGNEAPGGSGIYGMREGETTVYLLPSYSFTNALGDSLSFVQKTVVEPPEGSVDAQGNGTVLPESATFAGSLRPEPLVVTKDIPTEQQKSFGMTTYMMSSPKKRAVDTGKTTEAIASLLSITADAVVAYNPTPEQMNTFGLDVPYSTVSFSYKDTNDKAHTVALFLSAPNAQGTAYLMKEGTPLIYQMAVSKLPWYDLTYSDFVSTLQLLPFIDNVKTVTVSSPTDSYVFALEGENDALKVTCNGQEVDTDSFRTFYQTLIGVPSEEFTTDVPPDPATAVLSIAYAYRDGALPADSVLFLPGPTRKVFMAINGEAEFYTKASYVDTILKNAANMLTGDAIVPLY